VSNHRGGGAETYLDVLATLKDWKHERFALSSGRIPLSALVSFPFRWPCTARRRGHSDIVHAHGDVAAVLALPLMRRFRKTPVQIATASPDGLADAATAAANFVDPAAIPASEKLGAPIIAAIRA